MHMNPTGERNHGPQLQLWPGIVAVTLQWLIRYGIPAVFPEATFAGVIGGCAGGLAVLVWWAFFSRAPKSERWGAVALIVVAMAATPRILDKSIATGMMGLMFFIYSIPILSLAFVAWAVATRRLGDVPRRVALVAAILVACAGWAFVRTNRITGDGRA